MFVGVPEMVGVFEFLGIVIFGTERGRCVWSFFGSAFG
jgi:hypothetical protein